MSLWEDNAEMQGEFFDNLNVAEKENKTTRKVIGGIYHYPEEKGFYMLYFNNAMYVIEKSMWDIEQDVEHGFDKNPTLLEGYTLAAVRVGCDPPLYEWQIRDSGRKHTKDYIYDKGPCTERFFNQVTRFSKSF